MIARRVVVVSPDKEIAKSLKLGLLAAGASVTVTSSLDELPAGEIDGQVLAIHLAGNDVNVLARLAGRLAEDAWVIALLDRPDLTVTVAAMQAHPQVAGVLVVTELELRELAAMAARLLHGDIFGIDKLLPWGTRIHSALVTDYQEKSVAIHEISEFAGAVGVRRKYREAIEQCADEMLMNALYDAPVSAEGKPLFAEIPTKTRVSLRLDKQVVVQYGCDGHRFALSVRDAYGSFERATLIQYLYKCLHSEEQIDRKEGGAGLGLYLIANAATSLYFHLLPGAATECIAVFDIAAPKLQLRHIAVHTEKVDAAGRLVGGPSRLAGGFPVERRQGPRGPSAPVSSPRSLTYALAAAIALLLALIAMVAYPRLIKREGAVKIATDPVGARIEVDGKSRGTTTGGPLEVGGLDLGTSYRVMAHLDGYGDAETLIEPMAGQTPTVSLHLLPRSATLTIESDPPGATVLYGELDLGRTPLVVTTLPPGGSADLVLRKAGFGELRRTVKVPPAGGEAGLSASLPMDPTLASVHITSTPPGATVYLDGQLLAGLTTPIDEHLLEAGKHHELSLRAPGFMPATIDVDVGRGQRGIPVDATLEPGGSLTLTANLPAKVSVSGSKACKHHSLPLAACPLENGRHKIRLDNREPYLAASFEVTVQGDEIRRDLRYGIVQARDGFELEAAGGTTRAVALEEGARQVTVVSKDGGARQTVALAVRAGTTVSVP